MPQNTILALQGLTCMKCVDRVKNTLETHPNVTSVKVTRQFAKILHDTTADELITLIEKLGYQATLADKPTQSLNLSDLNCQHCINRVEKALNLNPDIIADVYLDHADIYGQADTEQLIKTVEELGYHAQAAGEPSYPKTKPLQQKTPESVLAVPAQTLETASLDSQNTVHFIIDGMSCASCVLRVERALQSVAGVSQARVNLADRTALVIGNANIEAMIQAVKKSGYGAELVKTENERRQRQHDITSKNFRQYMWRAIFALIIGIPMMIWGIFDDHMMITDETRPLWLLLGILSLAVLIFAGKSFFVNAIKNLRQGTATMDTLVALGTFTAWAYSMMVTLWPDRFPANARHVYFEASVMIIGLVNLGHALEQRARQRSSRALEKLLDLTPPSANIVTDEGEKMIPLNEIQPGMTVKLVSGDRVPVDGKISQGEIWLNESMLTGEASSQHKTIDQLVHAGTIIEDGQALFTVTATGNQTTLARIIELVRKAQSSKPRIAQLADKVSTVFVPAVIGIALLSGLIWYVIGPQPNITYALIITTTVLIIACPCALGLATPMSIIAGVGRAAELGVLIHDADALQKASQVDTLVFDKTGTLTKGKPAVTALYSFEPYTQQQVLIMATVLERNSRHPLAKAILDKAIADKVENTQLICHDVKTLKGLGLTGIVEEQQLLLGNEALLDQQQIDYSVAHDTLQQETEKGGTPVLLAIDGKLAALFIIRDQLRQDSVSALNRLRKQGYQLIMMTGDHPKTANAIAKEAGIDKVIAGILPDEKSEKIIKLQNSGYHVAMVGDGINDAPALAQADVSIAMGDGSDIAIETASLVLTRHSLHGVADALLLANAVIRNIKQNLFAAFIYNVLGIPLAAGVLYPITGTLLSPIIAGAAMALSSITVVSNANRLLFFKPKE